MKNLPGFASLLATSPFHRKRYMNNGGQAGLAGMLGQKMQANQQAYQNANQNAQFQRDRQEVAGLNPQNQPQMDDELRRSQEAMMEASRGYSGGPGAALGGAATKLRELAANRGDVMQPMYQYGQSANVPWNAVAQRFNTGLHQANDNYLNAAQYAPMDRAEYMQETMQRNEDPAEMDWKARRRERLLRRKQRMAAMRRNSY
jgi:hypothetical protein